ncbi:M20 family metallopeptidase [Microbacterium sp. 4R-513]|uniref:M20/M25/M40 family metallo-hydrolase n=1 Tax=Microbacterium sp. 4R-513 TaxID=2567934 RepID=UPI0013E1125D|nr:M20/M25/M40 family metallo-hydrolase [Microbacterium sp. 4R-513]QIG39500.1 M20 family metallopeptidase [Microbacterium sp. 4R-513]
MDALASPVHDDGLRDAARRRLEELVRCETPSGDIDALERFAGLLESRWSDLGVRSVRTGTAGGPVLVGDLPGRGWGERLAPVLLITHADTVWPVGTLESRVRWRREDGLVRGPGIFDMKSGIVIIETVVGLLAAAGQPHPPLRIFVAPDEETGSAHSAPLLQEAAVGCAAGLGFESPHPDGAPKVGRFGSMRLRISVTGRAAHAALDPGLGISAIDELVDQLLVVRRLVEPYATGDQPVLLNVGRVEAEGKTNVVSARAVAEIGLRFARQDQEDDLLPRITGLHPVRHGAMVDIEVLSHRPPWASEPRDAALAARLFGGDAGRPARGSADTNMLAGSGLPLVDGLGARGAGAHADREHIVEESLWERVALLHHAFTDEHAWSGSA